MQFDASDSARNGAGRLSPQHTHVVQFYENDDFLYDALSRFVGSGLTAGQPAVVIARAETRRALADRLNAVEIDYHEACRTGRLNVRDARDALAGFMRGSRIDEDRLAEQIGSVIRSARGGSPIGARAFGEMVDVLFRDGNTNAAIRVEELWNELAQQEPFELLGPTRSATSTRKRTRCS